MQNRVYVTVERRLPVPGAVGRRRAPRHHRHVHLPVGLRGVDARHVAGIYARIACRLWRRGRDVMPRRRDASGDGSRMAACCRPSASAPDCHERARRRSVALLASVVLELRQNISARCQSEK